MSAPMTRAATPATPARSRCATSSVAYRVRGRRPRRCCAASRSRSAAASPTASWASRAAASRRPRCAIVALPAAQRPHPRRRRSRSAGEDVLGAARRASCASCRARTRLDGLPEPGHGAQPVDPDRPPARRGVRGRAASSAARPRDRVARDAAQGADRRPGVGHGALPAPALRRHAAARRDRDGARRRIPTLLILDEPTTGLDATVEAEVLDLVAEPAGRAAHRGALHQPQPRRDRARCATAWACSTPGELVEEGTAAEVLAGPAPPVHRRAAALHPARRRAQGSRAARHDPGLPAEPRRRRCRAASSPTAARSPRTSAAREEPPLDRRRRAATAAAASSTSARRSCRARRPRDVDAARRSTATPSRCCAFDDLGKTFRQGGHDIHALVGVSAAIWPGETLGLVGESGCGKTTLARTLLGIIEPDDGRGRSSTARVLAPRARRSARARTLRALQIVFQNPDSALNRRHTVRRILRPLARRSSPGIARQGRRRAHRTSSTERGAPAPTATSRPRPVAALGRPEAARRDRARVRRRPAARRLRRADLGARRLRAGRDPQPARRAAGASAASSYLFISHDLGVVRYLSDRIAVLYLGRLMELGPAEVVFGGPHHPYTEALLSAVPTDRRRAAASGSGSRARSRAPPTRPPAASSTRAARARSARSATTTEPPLVEVEPGHLMRCHIPIEELRALQTSAPVRLSPASIAGTCARSGRARTRAARAADVTDQVTTPTVSPVAMASSQASATATAASPSRGVQRTASRSFARTAAANCSSVRTRGCAPTPA